MFPLHIQRPSYVYKRLPLYYQSTVITANHPRLQSTDTWHTTQSTKTPQTAQSIDMPKPSSLLNTQNQQYNGYFK